MLDLPQAWQSRGANRIVEDLLKQADGMRLYATAARAMARSALEFMLDGPRWSDPPRRPTIVPSENGWQINDWLYYVPPCADDRLLAFLAEPREPKSVVTVLAPPWAIGLIRCAIAVAPTGCHIELFQSTSPR